MIHVPVAPLLIDVYSKTFQHLGRIGDPKFCTVIPRFNAVGSATIGLLASQKMIPRLFDGGARLVIRDPRQSADDGVVMSGRVDDIRGSGKYFGELLEVDIIDDFTLFDEVLGWVIPTAPISAQGTAGTNWTMTGPSETVLRAALYANAVTRLGLPVSMAASAGRGGTITAKLRFDPLSELFPTLDGAGLTDSGLGVTVKQSGAGLVVRAYIPTTYARVLTPRSGEVGDWSYSIKNPTATRVAIGGQGEAQARVFRTVVDAAVEADIGWKIERWRDARDVDAGADMENNLQARGRDTLKEGAKKAGLSLELAETARFQYGRNVRVGDRVSLDIGTPEPITDVLAEATLSWTQDDGWKRTPKVGDKTDDPDATLLRGIKMLARKIAKGSRG